MILEPEMTMIDIRARSKKQVLEDIARGICQHFQGRMDCTAMLNSLVSRENIGSTGIGGGGGIPHVRIKGLKKNSGVFVRLKTPVDFDSADGQPVDLIYVLLASGENRGSALMELSRVSNFFRNPEYCERLRACKDPFGSIHACNEEQARAAA